MSSATQSGIDVTAAAPAPTGATKQQKYGYRGQQRHQRNARRRQRMKELKAQVATCESLIKTFTVMRNQADAELAALAEDEHAAKER